MLVIDDNNTMGEVFDGRGDGLKQGGDVDVAYCSQPPVVGGDV